MPGSRVVRLDAQEWSNVVAAARAAEAGAAAEDPVAAELAEHLAAPVTAHLVATAGRRGTTTRLTVVGERVLVVTQRLAEGPDGSTLVEPAAELIFTQAPGMWPAVARALPAVPLLREPAERADGGPATPLDLSPDEVRALLAREDANLHVRVERAAGAGGEPAVSARLWSVVEGRLLDVRSDGGSPRLVVCPPGSVAAHLAGALSGRAP